MYDLHCFNLFLICFKSLPVSPFCRTSILVSLIPLVYAIYGGRNMVKHHIRANVQYLLLVTLLYKRHTYSLNGYVKAILKTLV